MKIREEEVRTAAVLGGGACDKLHSSRVAVFGVGGVGGYVCEALARAGVGHIDIFDGDVVALSNLNRQIIALHSTVGLPKVEVMKNRIIDINPECEVTANKVFFKSENSENFDFSVYDYVVDAVDDVDAKIEIIVKAKAAGVPVISSMGTAKKLDPTAFKVADIYKTSVCPLAKVVRKKLRERGVDGCKVVFSEEPPADSGETLGSVPFVPPIAGFTIAGEVIKDLIK